MKGCYILIIGLKKDSITSIGKIGDINFNKGYYIYVGSALNGLTMRIKRHMKKQKKIHWHIDYLLKNAKILDIYYKESKIREECDIAKKLNKYLKNIPGFGCSDCRCESHLFYSSKENFNSIIDKLSMVKYTQ
jgi:Uri superfamily endonuclease